MNIEEIDKWLDNEYGCSYTRLEELHDYFFEKYTDQKEEIERLNNIINEAIEYIELGINFDSLGVARTKRKLLDILDKENKQ